MGHQARCAITLAQSRAVCGAHACVCVCMRGAVQTEGTARHGKGPGPAGPAPSRGRRRRTAPAQRPVLTGAPAASCSWVFWQSARVSSRSATCCSLSASCAARGSALIWQSTSLLEAAVVAPAGGYVEGGGGRARRPVSGGEVDSDGWHGTLTKSPRTLTKSPRKLHPASERTLCPQAGTHAAR